jgi:exopolyphosphatase/guanosine-5'-triphosphate,3'-diphosphate pyrophosphatase
MNSDLREETLALRGQYDEEPSHSDHVTVLALQLFDGWEPWHGLGGDERDLLECAALLHDIGWSQTPDGTGHHKHSARLIGEHAWRHLSAPDVAIVAQVARYHRKTLPQPHHERFHALPDKAQRQVMILGGILRVADALDVRHQARHAPGRLRPRRALRSVTPRVTKNAAALRYLLYTL